MAAGRGDPDDRRRVQGDQAPLHPRCRRAQRADRTTGRRAAATPQWCSPSRFTSACSKHWHTHARPTPDHLLGDHGRARRRPRPSASRRSGRDTGSTCRSRSSSRRRARFTAATLAFVDELGDRWENDTITVIVPELYRRPLVAAPAPQPELAAAEGATAVSQGDGRHVDPVPGRAARRRRRTDCRRVRPARCRLRPGPGTGSTGMGATGTIGTPTR